MIKQAYRIFPSLFLFTLIFLLGTNSTFSQDSLSHKNKYRTGMTINVGTPSGASLFIHRQLAGRLNAEAGVGYLPIGLSGFTYNAGLKFHVGSDSSNDIVGLRFTHAVLPGWLTSGVDQVELLSVYYGLFHLNPAHTPFSVSIGLSEAIGTNRSYTTVVFCEVGLRLFSF